MSRRKNRPKYSSSRAEDQFGFLLNKNYNAPGGRSRRTNIPEEEIDENRAKAQALLSNFAQKLGRGVKGTADFLTGNRFDFDDMGKNPVKPATDSISETNILEEGTSDPKRELLSEDQLLDKVNDLYRKNVLQQTAIREFELGREARRNMAAAQQYNQMINLAAENTARRKLMEDTFSPTKISQQRLRAQTGEAALMNAIANQGTSAAQIGNIGTSRRYGR